MDWESKGPGGKTLGKWHMSFSTKITVVLMVIFIGGGIFGLYAYWHPGELKKQVRVPATINGWVNLGPEGKAISVIAVSPSDENIIYAGNAKELFRSDDKGKTWNALNLDVDPGHIS